MANLYALLVGINAYPEKPLQGCINDVKAMEDYLKAFYGENPRVKLHIKRMIDTDEEKPIRENLIKGFDHFKNAESGDTCLFYYSGHGSYSPAPEGFWTDATGMVQSFVCLDSRAEGGRDLIDKEMGFLIWKTVEGRPGVNFIAITDCCHSGTITKNIDDSGITDRMCSANSVPSKAEDYFGFDYTKDGKRGYEISMDANGKKKLTVRQGNHIHIAASGDKQTSKELTIDGARRGAFTHSLLKTLHSSGNQITYKDLLERITILVWNLVPDQTPLININGTLSPTEKTSQFLSLESEGGTKTNIVSRHPKHGWIVNAGTVHGVCKGDKVIVETVTDTIVIGGPAPDFSILLGKPEFGAANKIYTAIIERQPNQPIKFSFHNEVPQNIQDHISASAEKSSLVSLLKEGTGQFIIRCEMENIFVTRPGDEQPIFNALEVKTTEQASFFIDQLDIICRWLRLQEFNNPLTKLSNEHYTLKLYRDKISSSASKGFEEVGEIKTLTDLAYTKDGDEWKQPSFRLSIKNNLPARSLWLTSAYLGFDYSISIDYFAPVEIAAGQEYWLSIVGEGGLAEDVIPAQLDERYEKLGFNEIIEYLKLFIGTVKVNVDDLWQTGIDLAEKKSQAKGDSSKGIGIVRAEDNLAKIDWKTETLGFRIIKSATGEKANAAELANFPA